MQQIGRYEIQRELGRGAMGVVYAAVDPLIGRQVAIKTIRLGLLDTEGTHQQLTERLRREAKAAGALSHPGIITIYDQGEQGDDAYIVMEFIDGVTIEEVLVSAVPQPSSSLLSILRKAADALDYAHNKGIIHRDIKPSNIMVCRDGSVKIADFGIAKLTASMSMTPASASLTQAGLVVGTPNYMSPEQAHGHAIDGRSDQFSLAVVAYRILTGKLPFEGPTLTALLAKILWEEPEYEAAGLGAPVRSIFERALKKDPQMRFPNCAEFVRELENAYAIATTEVHTALNTVLATPNVVSQHEDSLHRPSAPSEKKAGRARRKKSTVVWMTAAGVVALAAALFLGVKAFRTPAPATQTATEIKSDSAGSLQKTVPENPPLPEPAQKATKTEAPVAPPSRAAKTDLPKRDGAEIPISKPKQTEVPVRQREPASTMQTEAPIRQPEPTSGVLTWSGDLQKNSILIITDKANIGSIEGKLPGKPVRIEVEPKDLVVRRGPGDANGWNQIILYSGNRRYDSIMIRWKLIQ